MIIEGVMWVFMNVLTGMFSLLPDLDIPFQSDLNAFGSQIGSTIGGFNGFIPISEAVVPVTWAMTVYLPFVFSFYFVRWIYARIPVVGS